jgi:hypothetical protein
MIYVDKRSMSKTKSDPDPLLLTDEERELIKLIFSGEFYQYYDDMYELPGEWLWIARSLKNKGVISEIFERPGRGLLVPDNGSGDECKAVIVTPKPFPKPKKGYIGSGSAARAVSGNVSAPHNNAKSSRPASSSDFKILMARKDQHEEVKQLEIFFRLGS